MNAEKDKQAINGLYLWLPVMNGWHNATLLSVMNTDNTEQTVKDSLTSAEQPIKGFYVTVRNADKAKQTIKELSGFLLSLLSKPHKWSKDSN